MMEEEVGKITHFFDKINVAVLQLSGSLKLGDAIRIVDEKRGLDFTQTVESMQVDHESVESAAAGTDAALKVNQKVHEGAKVYRIQ